MSVTSASNAAAGVTLARRSARSAKVVCTLLCIGFSSTIFLATSVSGPLAHVPEGTLLAMHNSVGIRHNTSRVTDVARYNSWEGGNILSATGASGSGSPTRVQTPERNAKSSTAERVGVQEREVPAPPGWRVVSHVSNLKSELRAVCGQVMSHPRPVGQSAALTMPIHMWTRLRVRANALLAQQSCESTRWPIRESLLPFQMSPALSDRNSSPSVMRLTTVAPLEWGDYESSDLVAVVDAAAVCSGETLMEDEPPPVRSSVYLKGDAVRRALCGKYDGVRNLAGVRRKQKNSPAQLLSAQTLEKSTTHGLSNVALLSPEASLLKSDAFLGVVRICQRSASESRASAVWHALLDATSADGAALQTGDRIPCLQLLSPGRLLSLLTKNYIALHTARNMTTLVRPRELAAGLVLPGVVYPNPQVPSTSAEPAFPALHPNIRELAAAAHAGDATSFRRLLLPAGFDYTLPRVLTSFNVMVSARGVLSSLATLLDSGLRNRDKVGEEHAIQNQSGCDPALSAAFAPEPHEIDQARKSVQSRLEEAALGGAVALMSLRARAPNVSIVPCWPGHGEVLLPHGSDTFVLAVGGAPASTACESPWDFNKQRVPVYDELVVLTEPHLYSAAVGGGGGHSDSFAADAVGRLALLNGYLEANQHVVVHVSAPIFQNISSGQWGQGDLGPIALAWMRLIGLPVERLVTGRVIGVIVHVLDRLPPGPRYHPLQLLALRDVITAALSRTAKLATATGSRTASPSLPPSNWTGINRTEYNRRFAQGRGGSIVLLQRRGVSRSESLNITSVVDLPRRIPPENVTGQTTWRDSHGCCGWVDGLAALRERLRNNHGLNATIVSQDAGDAGRMTTLPAGSRTEVDAATRALLDDLHVLSTADVVIAPHGAGLIAASAMRPHATIAQTLPQASVGLFLDVLHTAHYARLNFHLLVSPGAQPAAAVGHDTARVLRIVCQAVACSKTPPAQLSAGDGAPPFRRNQTLEECIPPVPHHMLRLTPSEPLRALTPWLPLNLSINCSSGRPAGPQYAWISHENVLPLSRATGGVALLLPAANLNGDFYAEEPTQRALIRALEAQRILPAALPKSVCCATTTGHCYLSPHNVCTNADVAAAATVGAALLAAIRRAAGLASKTYLPLYSVGLSAGATFTGSLSARVRLDGSILQMMPPGRGLAALLVPGGGGSVNRNLSCAALGPDAAADVLRSVPLGSLAQPFLPPLWMTAASLNPAEERAVTDYETLLVRNYSVPRERVVVNHWLAGPLGAAWVHEMAPWIVSKAAGRIVIDSMHAAGLLYAAPPREIADRMSHAPRCNTREGNAPVLGDNSPITDVAEFLLSTDPPLTSPYGKHDRKYAIEELRWALRSAFSFPAAVSVAEHVGGPRLFASYTDPEWPRNVDTGAVMRFTGQRTVTARCVVRNVTVDGTLGGLATFIVGDGAGNDTSTRAACRFANEGWLVLDRYMKRLLQEILGKHEYHRAPWESMVAWLTSVGKSAAHATSPVNDAGDSSTQ